MSLNNWPGHLSLPQSIFIDSNQIFFPFYWYPSNSPPLTVLMIGWPPCARGYVPSAFWAPECQPSDEWSAPKFHLIACLLDHYYYQWSQDGVSGSRHWGRVQKVNHLLGINTCEEKRKDSKSGRGKVKLQGRHCLFPQSLSNMVSLSLDGALKGDVVFCGIASSISSWWEKVNFQKLSTRVKKCKYILSFKLPNCSPEKQCEFTCKTRICENIYVLTIIIFTPVFISVTYSWKLNPLLKCFLLLMKLTILPWVYWRFLFFG